MTQAIHSQLTNDPTNPALHNLHAPGYLTPNSTTLAAIGTAQAGDFAFQKNTGQVYKFFNSTFQLIAPNNNLNASVSPTSANDNTQGYSVGSLWFDQVHVVVWTCFDASTAAANWQTGSGNIFGPTTSTTFAIARFQNTSGKLLEDSTVTLDNSGNFNNVSSIVGPALSDLEFFGASIDMTVTGDHIDLTSATNINLDATAGNISIEGVQITLSDNTDVNSIVLAAGQLTLSGGPSNPISISPSFGQNINVAGTIIPSSTSWNLGSISNRFGTLFAQSFINFTGGITISALNAIGITAGSNNNLTLNSTGTSSIQLNSGSNPLTIKTSNSTIDCNSEIRLMDSLGSTNIGNITTDSFTTPTQFQINTTPAVPVLVFGTVASVGQKLVVSMPIVYTTGTVSNLPTGGSIGLAGVTVDILSSFTVNQTTAGQTLSISAPTDTTIGRFITIMNVGSTSFTMLGVSISAGAGLQAQWNGSAWALLGHG